MAKRKIELGTFEISRKMKEYVAQALNLGRLSYGPLSQELEQRFATMHGCKFGVLSNSGTSSLLVALQTLKELHGWDDGDEVICPALTFVATVNVVLQLRLKPVLVDVEPGFYGLDPAKIQDAVSYKTRAIMPVHTFGQPANMLDIVIVSKSMGLAIVEDSCEAMAVKHQGRPVGAWSDIACFSTYVAHLLVTGVGGIAITNNSEYAQYMRSLTNHGIDLTELPNGQDYDPTWLARKFTFSRVGHSFRITELEAALGLAQLDDLAGIIKRRQENAEYITAGLQDLGDRLQLPVIRPNTESSWMMYPLVCRQAGVRDRLMAHLNGCGIGTRLMLPLVNQPVYRGLFCEDDYPVAKWINANGFYTSSHQGLSRDDLDYLIDSIRGFYER